MMSIYGYDDKEFVDPPPEYLKCLVCRLVLKNPVQIMQCGHRCCELCFERIKGYSTHLNSALCCPADRKEIDISQVFKDTGMTRIIADLHVKCTFHIHGCSWTGELRNFMDHKKNCNHAMKEEAIICSKETSDNEANTLLWKDMCQRLDKCEEGILEKEKELAYFKFNLQEIKEKINQMDKEMDTLKLKNVDLVSGNIILKETNKTLQERIDKVLLKYDKEMDTSKFKNVEMVRENTILKETNKTLQECIDKVLLKYDKEMDTFKLKNVEMVREIDLLKETNKTLQESIDKLSIDNYLSNKNESDQLKMERMMHRETQHLTNDEIQSLKGVIEEINDKLVISRSEESHKTQESIKIIEMGLKDQLTRVNHEMRMKENHVDKLFDDVKGQLKDLSDKVDQEPFDEIFNKINELKAYVNHTHGLFSFKNISLKNTSFIWTIRNFREQFDARKKMESSKFYCRPRGHLCQLFGHFEVGERDMLLCFRLAKGENSADVENFEMNILCELLYNDGRKVSHIINSTTINKYREQSFTFNHNSDVTVGIRFKIPFKKDDMEKYLIDNTCTIACTLMPN